MKKILVYLILIFLSMDLNAAIRIEPKSINEVNGTAIDLGLNFLYSTGNTEKMVLGSQLKFQYGNSKTYKHLVLFSTSYGEVSDVTNTNKFMVHYRFVHSTPITDLEYELFAQDEYNEFQNLETRALSGINIKQRLRILNKLFLGGGLMYSYMVPTEINSKDEIKKRIKGNLFLFATHKFNKYASITYLGFYQPNIKEVSDFTTFNYLQFDSTITKEISFNINIQAHYNSTPYENVEKDDIKTTIGISYKIK